MHRPFESRGIVIGFVCEGSGPGPTAVSRQCNCTPIKTAEPRTATWPNPIPLPRAHAPPPAFAPPAGLFRASGERAALLLASDVPSARSSERWLVPSTPILGRATSCRPRVGRAACLPSTPSWASDGLCHRPPCFWASDGLCRRPHAGRATGFLSTPFWASDRPSTPCGRAMGLAWLATATYAPDPKRASEGLTRQGVLAPLLRRFRRVPTMPRPPPPHRRPPLLRSGRRIRRLHLRSALARPYQASGSVRSTSSSLPGLA